MLLQVVTVSVGLDWFVASAVCLVSYAFGLLVVVLAFELGLLIWFAFVVCGCVGAFCDWWVVLCYVGVAVRCCLRSRVCLCLMCLCCLCLLVTCWFELLVLDVVAVVWWFAWLMFASWVWFDC